MPLLPEAFNWFEEFSALRDWWGLIALVLAFGLSFAVFFIFRHFNKLGGIVARLVLLALFSYRLVLVFQFVTETGDWLNVVPWQISQLCSVLLPIAILCNFPRCIKAQVSLLSFVTGLLMMVRLAAFPSSFASAGATAIVDAILSNAILTLTPLLLLVTDEIKFNVKRDLLCSLFGLGLLIGWAYLVNVFLYPGHNVMGLDSSVVPFAVTGIPVLDYLIVLLPLLAVLYLVLFFFTKRHALYREKRNARLAREKVLLKEDKKAKRARRKDLRQKRKEEHRKELIEESDAPWEQ